MYKDIKDAHNQKKERKKKQGPVTVIETRNNSTLTTIEDNTWATKEILQKQRLQERNNAQTLSS